MRPSTLKAVSYLVVAGAACVLASSLTACGTPQHSGAEKPGEVVEVSEPLPGESEFDTVVELRDAVVGLGFPCPHWDQTDKVGLATSSALCNDDTVLSVYADTETKEENIAAMQSFWGEDMPQIGLIVGPNWIINAPDAEKWSEELGATAVIWGKE